MEKITKKNSILFNQLWINKAIEDGNSYLLINKKISDQSIGEIIEYNYETNNLEQRSPKVKKHDSLLFTREWVKKFQAEGLTIPNRRITTKYSLGEILALKYFEIELARKQKENNREKILKISFNRK